ncbi:MAG TPA: NADH-quinone oxidoreductase subunit NuoF [Dehalococcoidia bacterium]|nr:NADH-quinone oxidoreductase subunit NuoF [Dehalococcoidia bacterium]
MKVAELSAITSAFQEIKNRAELRWQTLYDSGKPVIMVGTATCGRAAGALEVLKAIRDELKRQNLDFPVIEVGCLGHCYAEPLVIISKPEYPPICYGRVNPVIAERLVKEFVIGDNPCLEFVLGALEENDLVPSFSDFPRAKYEKKVILKNCGQIDPKEIDHYIAKGGYSSLVKALHIPPEQIIEELKRSGLRGRGGAGFPTGRKWEVCCRAVGEPKYVICNGDEGDPGAFMDRVVLESDPHSIIEGMIIAGYTVGARYGYIYVRAEYPLAVEHVQIALRQARRLNLLGKNILGSDFSFDIRLFQGSGAFVCGEETALIASLEGKPGIPYYRPPYPAVKGLYGKPTLFNNVKTFAYVRHIINDGAECFASIGDERSKGTAVFALAGKVVNTGLAEVPMGTTLRQVIFDVGSGIPGGKHFKAVQIGGPSGGCLPESALDLPIDFDSLSDAGAMMGSGGMVVLDEDDCMVEIARYFLEFTQSESCGKCTFCRLGTKQMLEILNDITQGRGRIDDIDMLSQLAEDVIAGSLCGLGKTAPNPVLTTLRYFRDEYEAHIKEGRCPALMCRDLIAYYIIPEKCERSCDACVGTCTVEAITTNKKRIKVIDQEKCVKCGTCLDACPPQYNAVIKLSPPSEVPS